MGSRSAPESAVVATSAPTTRFPLLRYLINTDVYLSLRLHSVVKPFIPRSIFLLLELSADFRFLFPLSLSFLLTSFTSPDFLHHPFLIPLILGFLLDLALVGLIKVIVGRSRPAYNHQSSMSVAVSPDNYSFPSGHASRVFLVASLFYLSNSAMGDVMKGLRNRIGFFESWISRDERTLMDLVILVVWSWAIATSMSRIFLGRHFVFDVLAGACLGVFEAVIAFCFLRF